jgi:hypothetical protein
MAGEAKALAMRLRDFTKRYPTPKLVLHPGRMFDLAAPAQDLDALALLVEDRAAAFKDAGGPTPRLRAFKVLSEGLIRAYRRATEQKGTGHSAREGRLLDLVEAVLATALKLARDETGKPFETPASTHALGEQLHEIARHL